MALPIITNGTCSPWHSRQKTSRNVVATVNHFSVAYEMLRHSDLIAVLPRELAARSPLEPFQHAMPLLLNAPPRIVSLFWQQRNDTAPAHRWLRQILVNMLARGHHV